MDNGKYNHFEYCEAIARKLRAIQHTKEKKKFFPATESDDIATLDERMSSASGVLFIAINGTESTFDWKNSDSLMEQPIYMFAIVEQTDSDNSNTIFEAQQHCKAIAMQVIARMMQDYHSEKNGLHLLDPASFQMKGFGPIRDNFYGVVVSFSFNQGVNYKIVGDLWV